MSHSAILDRGRFVSLMYINAASVLNALTYPARAFTLSIDEFPIAGFLAKNYAEARELIHEQWLKEELAAKRLRDRPLWIADATLSVRSADELETAAYHEGKAAAESEDGLFDPGRQTGRTE